MKQADNRRASYVISILLAPPHASRVFQWSLPEWAIIAGVTVLGLMMLGGILGIAAISRVIVLSAQAETVNLENDILRTKVSRVDELEHKLNELSEVNARMQALAGLDSYQDPGPDYAAATAGTSEHESEIDPPGAWRASLPELSPYHGPISRGFQGADAELPHPGIDIAGRAGSPILAAGGGVVVQAKEDEILGRMVILVHGDSLQTLYGHNQELLVGVGDSVRAGAIIARLGSTGRSSAPHLHFEVHLRGVPVDPGRFVEEYAPTARDR